MEGNFSAGVEVKRVRAGGQRAVFDADASYGGAISEE